MNYVPTSAYTMSEDSTRYVIGKAKRHINAPLRDTLYLPRSYDIPARPPGFFPAKDPSNDHKLKIIET